MGTMDTHDSYGIFLMFTLLQWSSGIPTDLHEFIVN